MLNAENSRKAINFDLDDNLLRKYYPSKKSYKNGWRDISRFLKESDFEHNQYSGYISKKHMSYADVNRIILYMCYELPWFSRCLLHCDVTALLEEYSVKKMIEENVLKRNLSK